MFVLRISSDPMNTKLKLYHSDTDANAQGEVFTNASYLSDAKMSKVYMTNRNKCPTISGNLILLVFVLTHHILTLPPSNTIIFLSTNNSQLLGCNMGHTIPAPLHTVPVMELAQYLQVTGVVLHKTHGIGGTCGFYSLKQI